MRLVLADRLPEGSLAVLPPDLHVVVSPADLRPALGEADGLCCLLTSRVDEALLRAAPKLRVVANVATGVDNVDLAAATRLGVVVTHTPGVLTEATADLAFALILGVARRLIEGDTLVRGGEFRGWRPDLLLGAEVSGATVGIVGLGRIGRAVARRAGAFGMRVLYAAPRAAPPSIERTLGAERVPLARLLAESDFVTLHCPLA
ncbi:MAG: NAD(P)-dependent oxidoreductase, partial [Myxococcota bacterium]